MYYLTSTVKDVGLNTFLNLFQKISLEFLDVGIELKKNI